MTNLLDKKIKKRSNFSWTSPKIEVRKSLNSGKGIFSKKLILKDEILIIFGGNVFHIEELKKLPEEVQDWGLQIEENFILGYRNTNEIEDAVYVNHSCEPNAGFNGQIALVAMRDINKDEEVCFDYAMVLHHSKFTPNYRFNCLCNSSKCRKIVTENDWKSLELQKKYKGYFQNYLQNKINNK